MEEKILDKVKKYRKESKEYRKIFETSWQECESFYDGDQWKDRDEQKRTKNYIFQTIESEIPLLMDPMPSTDVVSIDEDYEDKAPILAAAKKHVYRQQQLHLRDAQTIREMLKTGNAFQYVDFDPDGEFGEGSVVVKVIPWSRVYLDPAAETIDESRYVSIDVPLSKEDLRRRYPKTADEVFDSKSPDVYQYQGAKGLREDQNLGTGSGSNYADRYKSEDMTFVEETWIKDYSLEKIDEEETQVEITKESAELMQGINPDISKWEDHVSHIDGHLEQKAIILSQIFGDQPINDELYEQAKSDPEVGLILSIIDDHIEMHQAYLDDMGNDAGKRPKYPGGWRLVVTTGNIIHFDGAPDIEDGHVPLVAWYCYKGLKIYADGVIKNLIPMQKTVNELDYKEVKGLKLTANPGWVVDAQSGVDDDTLTDEDGIVVTKEQGTEVSRLPPGQVSPQLSMRTQREIADMQRIEGVGEAVLGEAPKHALSGVSLRRLQMQSMGRIRLKSKMIEAAIERRDRLILSRIMKYWSTERKLRLDDQNGKVQFVSWSPKDIQDFSYEVILSPGTTAGMDAETIYETYKELLLAGAIDFKTFLQVVNIPKKQLILDKLEEADETQAQMQALQMENLQLKAQFAPQALTEEEVAMLEQMGVAQGNQPVTQGV